MRPAAHLLFLSRQEKKAKEGDPTVCVPARLAAVRATCGARSRRGRAKLAALRFAQTIARPFSAGRCAPRRIQKGGDTARAFAALGPLEIGVRFQLFADQDAVCAVQPVDGASHIDGCPGMSAPESLQRLRENGKGAVKHAKTTLTRAKISVVQAQSTGIPRHEKPDRRSTLQNAFFRVSLICLATRSSMPGGSDFRFCSASLRAIASRAG